MFLGSLPPRISKDSFVQTARSFGDVTPRLFLQRISSLVTPSSKIVKNMHNRHRDTERATSGIRIDTMSTLSFGTPRTRSP